MYLFIYTFIHFHLIGLQVKLLGEGVVAMTPSMTDYSSSFASLGTVFLCLCWFVCISFIVFVSLTLCFTHLVNCLYLLTL